MAWERFNYSGFCQECGNTFVCLSYVLGTANQQIKKSRKRAKIIAQYRSYLYLKFGYKMKTIDFGY
jgi:hypothetical protein